MKTKPPKYKTYAELSAAFKSGELQSVKDERGNNVGYYIRIDKGGSENRLRFYDPSLSDEENERRGDECRTIFRLPEEKEEINALFEALGIPAEWC